MTEKVMGLGDILPEHSPVCGGKASSLGRMIQAGLEVPSGRCVTTAAFDRYVDATGVRGRIVMELGRKEFDDMRWEEMWDASLRIASMFRGEEMPTDLREGLSHGLGPFSTRGVAVRSSAPGEDEEGSSFAGMHESYINVLGLDDLLLSVRKVWASLFSHRALLYRREIGLDPEDSAMAVVVQEMVIGDRSGVAFARNPEGEGMVVEAVWGLNQALVDGTVEPDRWFIDREDGSVLGHRAPGERRMMSPSGRIVPAKDSPPMGEEELGELRRAAMVLEDLFGSPQDMEFTFAEGRLTILQSRPITTVDDDERRRWYLSLERSFDSLLALRGRVEEALEGMDREAEALAAVDLEGMDDLLLESEIARREEAVGRWKAVYDRDLIPFAHGMRLFGEFYDDVIAPEDPYEFVSLLRGEELISVRRNRGLASIAGWVREEGLLPSLERGDPTVTMEVVSRIGEVMAESGGRMAHSAEDLVPVVAEMARSDAVGTGEEVDREGFLSRVPPSKRELASRLLDLGRASYRLRDDDNLHLGRLEAELGRALSASGREGSQRELKERPSSTMRARQLVGQPAVRGIATGPARVVEEERDLLGFRRGEVLVCDALDPNMTFVAPLCSAIVERRGGMLIHGAIIAREYGVPCVTGVPRATALIDTGDVLTVDGYLGLVIVSR